MTEHSPAPSDDPFVGPTASVLWRRLDLPGHETCTVGPVRDGWALSGMAVFAHDGAPCGLRYRVTCGPDWRTQSVLVTGTVGDQPLTRVVDADGAGRWTVDGVRCASVDGSLDIDLGFSPSTNLLPVRRLALADGESAEVVAAWLPFPSLRMEPLAQVYCRESGGAYRYTSAGGTFVRTLDVNAVGFVTRYPGLWEAEATSGAPDSRPHRSPSG